MIPFIPVEALPGTDQELPSQIQTARSLEDAGEWNRATEAVKTIPDVRLNQVPSNDPHADIILPPESSFFFLPSFDVEPCSGLLDIDARDASFGPRWMCEKLTTESTHHHPGKEVSYHSRQEEG